MPPWFYVLPMHPDAKLSDADKATLKSYLLAKSTKDKAEKDKAAPAKADKDKSDKDQAAPAK
jgi:hypothetical protein